MEKCKNCAGCSVVKHRTNEEKNKLTKRLNIIEGQVKGIKQMINDERYCQDILIQISAINKSLKSIGNEILKSHLNSCVKDALMHDDPEVMNDVVDLFDKLNK
jgi:DNA-binding FrmR family transcriptional regulator